MSHVLRVGVADQIGYFRAYNTDGSGKTDVTSATAGLSLSVFRAGLSSVSIASLSNKAADNTAHADGAIRSVGGNLYTVDLPDAATADQCPSVGVRGSFTGGVIEPVPHPLVGYNPASVAVGANITAPDNAGIAAIKAKTDNLPSDPADASDVSSSFSSIASSLSTIASYIDTEVAAIKAKTDALPSDPADASVIQASFDSITSSLTTLASYIDTEVAAIKAKTDNLPSDPADQSAIETAISTSQTALINAINAIETGAITGDNEITVTITDSDTSDPIEGAKIRYYRTGQAGGGTATVDVDGEVVVGLNSATWKWIASAAGYDSKTGTLPVSADGVHDIELDPSFATVADAPYCNVTLPAISQFTEEAAGIPCEFDFLGFLTGATRTAIVLNLPPDLVTGSDGRITVRLARLARYQVTYKIPFATFKIEPKVVKFSTPDAGSYTVVEPA